MDLIDRQDAIDAIIEWYGCEPTDMDYFKAILAKKPSAQPERKKGKWKQIGKDMYINLENAREQYKALGYPHRNELKLRCSVCGKVTVVDESILYNFCPHCGADMRGEINADSN